MVQCGSPAFSGSVYQIPQNTIQVPHVALASASSMRPAARTNRSQCRGHSMLKLGSSRPNTLACCPSTLHTCATRTHTTAAPTGSKRPIAACCLQLCLNGAQPHHNLWGTAGRSRHPPTHPSGHQVWGPQRGNEGHCTMPHHTTNAPILARKTSPPARAVTALTADMRWRMADWAHGGTHRWTNLPADRHLDPQHPHCQQRNPHCVHAPSDPMHQDRVGEGFATYGAFTSCSRGASRPSLQRPQGRCKTPLAPSLQGSDVTPDQCSQIPTSLAAQPSATHPQVDADACLARQPNHNKATTPAHCMTADTWLLDMGGPAGGRQAPTCTGRHAITTQTHRRTKTFGFPACSSTSCALGCTLYISRACIPALHSAESGNRGQMCCWTVLQAPTRRGRHTRTPGHTRSHPSLPSCPTHVCARHSCGTGDSPLWECPLPSCGAT